MANLPTLRSKEQIAGEIIDGFLARVDGVDDLNKGSVITQFIEAISQSNFKSAAAIISMIDALSVDRAEGEALQRLANDRNVPIFSAIASNGTVDITDLSFQKIETTVYAGQPAPVAGTTQIFVADAADFTSGGGKVYIGRGTPNVEGPLQYTSVSPQAGGAYWLITLSTSSPTTKFHNIGEKVLLGQGNNRTITSGTVVQTKQATSVTPVKFNTVSPATILDGEVTVSNVSVVCQQGGPAGNVPRGAIQEAVGLVFSASVYNPQPFSNGRDADTDDQIRDRIKQYEQLKAKGTSLAVQAAALNVVAPDELKRVTSSAVVTRADNTSTLIIDDGSGYEYNFSGVGIEQIIDSAIGGEVDLQLRKRPVAPARVETSVAAPYNIPDGYQLSVTISGVESVHTFYSTDFRVPGSSTAFEIAASINGDPNISFLASTAENRTKVVLYGRDFGHNDILVNSLTSEDANTILQFPVAQEFTARLYKNDIALYEDGIAASVTTLPQPQWSPAIGANGELTYSVDGTPDVTATFTLQAFQEISPTATVTNMTDINVWAAVMNTLMAGVTAVVQGNTIVLTSNKGKNSSASIEILGGTLKDQLFTAGEAISAVGQTSDYTLNRQTGQIQLSSQLAPGDKVSAGSPFTRAKVVTSSIPNGPSVVGRVWFIVDGAAKMIANELQASSQLTFTKISGNSHMTITSQAAGSLNPEGFSQIQTGDWILIWANPSDNPGLIAVQGWWRAESAETGQIIVNGNANLGSTINIGPIVIAPDRIVIVRSLAPIQRFEFPIQSLADFVTNAQSQLSGINVDLVGSAVRFSTQSAAESDGEILVVAVDAGGKNLSLPVGVPVKDIPSHTGFNVTPDSEVSTPSFTHSSFTGVISDNIGIDATFADLAGQQGDFIEILNKYDVSAMTLQPDSDRSRRALVTAFDSPTGQIDILTPTFMKSGVSSVIPAFNADSPVIQMGDRYFIRSSYQVDSQDSATIIIDNETTTQSYNVPVARKLLVDDGHSTPGTASFSATDNESTLALGDTASFGPYFSFKNFKAWRQAHAELSGASGYTLRFKAADFGPLGNKMRIGFVYPSSPTSTQLSHTLSISDLIDIGMVLPFTPATTNIDGSTSWTVSKATVGGRDQVTYAYRIGTLPDLSTVTIGNVAIISNSANFLSGNKGFSARIVGVDDSNKTFTVERPTGYAVADAISFSAIVNQSGVTTVTTSSAHSVSTGDRVGFYNTAPVTGLVKPFNSTYYATKIDTTHFTVPTPASAPGGLIASANLANHVITFNTQNPHGLYVGNVIIITGTPGAMYDGLIPVTKILTSNQFQCATALTGASSIGASGRFDFQSYAPTATTYAISAISRASSGLVTVTTASGSPSPSDIVKIDSVLVNAWVSGNPYVIGDTVSHTSILYKCTQTITGTTPPPSDPAHWTISTLDLTGVFKVETSGVNTFTYYYNDIGGTTSGTGGSVTKYGMQGSMARSVGKYSNLLSLGTSQTTSQDVIDYVTNSMTSLLSASILSGAGSVIIAQSTEDENEGVSYLSGSVVSISAIKASRVVEIIVNQNVPAGSTISLSTSASAYNTSYVIQSSVPSGANYLLIAQSPVFASVTGVVAGSSGTFLGSTPYGILVDGENFVLNQDLTSLIGNPMFDMKYQWVTAPSGGEEIRLLAYTSDQLTRFWNTAVVTGLSNVAAIENSQYGTQIQMITNKFGSSGSVQVAGGYANSGYVALVGSANQTDRVGYCYIPYDLRKGLNARNWIRLNQTVRENKTLGLASNTAVVVHYSGLEISSGPGTFQTVRATTEDYSTKLRIEKHGSFVAFVHIGGTIPSFNQVQEGDWVRITNAMPTTYDSAKTYSQGNKVFYNTIQYVAKQNVPTSTTPPNATYWKQYSDYDSSVTYSLGDYASYNGRLWYALGTSIGVVPGSDSTVWQAREFNPANTGIYKVVRVFADSVTTGGTFWVEIDNPIEELTTLLDSNDLAFYSYDSVMPGDTLVIGGDVLGSPNIGRYTVADDAADGSTQFPTATRIYTSTIPYLPYAVSTWSTGTQYALNDLVRDPDNQLIYKAVVATPTIGIKPSQNPLHWEWQSSLVSSPIPLGNQFNLVNVEENNPLELIKRIVTVGPSSNSLAAIVVDTPNLMNKVSSSLGAYLTMEGKLGLDTQIHYGLDGYKYFKGLVAEVNRVIYGDPTNSITYPGVRAAGTDIDIAAAILKRVYVSLSVRIRSEIPFTEVRDRVKSAVAGYVNTLGVGEQVSISEIVSAANSINGVIAVAVTSPTYDSANDLIAVGSDERAIILEPTSDVIVSVVSA